MMNTTAVVLEGPERLVLSQLDLTRPADTDVVVEVEWSGISTGTERLLWSGRMPPFPGMGYPLVPGYESVGRIVDGPASAGRIGERVFVPGARCFGEVRGLFGGAASRLVVAKDKVLPLDERLGEQGVLLALAATAEHAIAGGSGDAPDLIIGHGVLGRLLARLAVCAGGKPTVWELRPERRDGAEGYIVCDPADDDRRNYRAIYDCSGDPRVLDTAVSRLAKGGEIVLAGFYHEPVAFTFPPAFMREARFRIAAEWQPADLRTVQGLLKTGALSLAGLITHHAAPTDAGGAYRTAFSDPGCLKMVLDWRSLS